MNTAKKVTNSFYNQERVSYEKKSIDKLIVNEKEITKPNDILNELMIFYKALYASSSPNINCEQFEAMLQEPGLPKLSQEDQNKCEGSVTYEECENALKSMSIGKSPGFDGLTTDFLKKMWPLVG